MTVLFKQIYINAYIISDSDWLSILDVASSKMSILGFFKIALANTILYFYPPDKEVVPSDFNLV